MFSLLTQLSSKSGPTDVQLPEGWTISDGILVPSGRTLSVVAAGTVYALTNASAAVAFGTTSPSLVIDRVGTWFIQAFANLKRNAATIVAETINIKLRRTNNTPADVTGAAVDLTPSASTTLSTTVGAHNLPGIIYTTTNINDAIALYGNVSATLGAGTVDVVAAQIVAIKLF